MSIVQHCAFSACRLRNLSLIWAMRSSLALGTLSENCCEDDAERAHVVAANIAQELQTRTIVHNRGDPRRAKYHNCPQLPSFVCVLYLCMFARRATRKCACAL